MITIKNLQWVNATCMIWESSRQSRMSLLLAQHAFPCKQWPLFFFIVASKWKKVSTVFFFICFLYVCYNYHAPRFLVLFFKRVSDNVRAWLCVQAWLCVCVNLCLVKIILFHLQHLVVPKRKNLKKAFYLFNTDFKQRQDWKKDLCACVACVQACSSGVSNSSPLGPNAARQVV